MEKDEKCFTAIQEIVLNVFSWSKKFWKLKKRSYWVIYFRFRFTSFFLYIYIISLLSTNICF